MKLRYLNKTGFLFLLAGMLFHSLQAQNFHWESAIGPAPADAYYKLLLSPPVTAALNKDFTDVRLYNSKNEEVPYLLYKDEAKQLPDRFISYPIVGKKYSTGCCSFIKVQNTLSNAIDHIVLEVNNADASRRMTLSGSYDGNSWFAVKDHYSVATFNGYEKGEKKTTTLLRFDFPLTDYTYYRFDFDDWGSWWNDYEYPIFVVRAGYTESAFIPEQVISLPAPVTQQGDSSKLKQSFVRIEFPEPQYIDHIRVIINNEKDYYRAASLYEITPPGVPYREKQIASTILSSRNSNEINLGNNRYQYLLLKINNEDDKPVNVTGAEAFQVMHYLVAELKSGETYKLRYGQELLPAPVYDMQYFRDKIPATMDVLNPAARTDISMKEQPTATVEKPSKTFFTHPAFIWGAIGVVILLLGFLSLRMLKDMGGKGPEA